jgi:hypothetical protein
MVSIWCYNGATVAGQCCGDVLMQGCYAPQTHQELFELQRKITVRYGGVAVVLQRCNNGVTVVLQWCYSGDMYLFPRQAAVFVLIKHLAAGGKGNHSVATV